MCENHCPYAFLIEAALPYLKGISHSTFKKGSVFGLSPEFLCLVVYSLEFLGGK